MKKKILVVKYANSIISIYEKENFSCHTGILYGSYPGFTFQHTCHAGRAGR